VGAGSRELSTDGSSSVDEFELSSSSADSFDDAHVDVVSLLTSSPGSFQVHDRSGNSGMPDNVISLCAGYGREKWMGLDVVLRNDLGVSVANDICRNSDPRDCVDVNPLGPDDVEVCILNSLLPLEVPVTWRFSLRRWPLRWVLHEGVSLWDHGRRHEQVQSTLVSNTRPRKGLREYNSSRAPPEDKEHRRDRILGDESIRLVSAKDCCAKRCCQFFPREKIKFLH
jgi:hypothetical protein